MGIAKLRLGKRAGIFAAWTYGLILKALEGAFGIGLSSSVFTGCLLTGEQVVRGSY